jgi:hypothetical protein
VTDGGVRTVLVFGAGASLAEAKAHRARQDREHPPLDATFFRRVKKYGRSPGLFARVQAQARRLDVPDLARSNPPVGLEDYIGRVYFNIHHNPEATATSAYFQIVDLYAWEVAETTNWMMGRSGPIKKVLQKEISAGNQVSVVTFNIDMLIENALQELVHSRPGAPWCLRDAYGFSVPPRMATTTAESFDYDGSEVTIPLYKMHGSLNWVFRHRDFYPPADLVSRPRRVWQLLRKRVLSSRTTLEFGGSGRSRWYTFPLIVPPVYEKHAFIRMHLQEVWENAEAALTGADRVVFWGYSFPAADTHARHFFEGMADRNPALNHPIVISPDPSTGMALWSLLRAKSVTQYGDVSTYLGS